jgi:hypothetical protein
MAPLRRPRMPVGHITLLDGGPVAVSGVVDQHVDAAEGILGLPHGGHYLLVVRHVEREGEGGIGIRLRQVRQPPRVACGDRGALTALKHRLGERAAKAG